MMASTVETMLYQFRDDTADNLWLTAANLFSSPAASKVQLGRGGATHEVLHVAFELTNPLERWVSSRAPAINIAFALAEVIWILRGRNDAAFLNYYNSELPKFAGDGAVYHGAYGHRLRNAHGFDQLDRAYEVLKANPDSRQVVLQIWNPTSDFPISNGAPAAPDIPCNLCSMLKVREGRLDWTQTMRSNDLFLGFVHNVVQFTFLQEIIAGWLGLDVGTYVHYSDSLHVYARDLEKMVVSNKLNTPTNSDHMRLGRAECERMFSLLELLIDKVVYKGSPSRDLISFWLTDEKPGPIQNIGLILICEVLRRRDEAAQIHGLLKLCTNELYVFLFSNWLARMGVRSS